MKMKSKREQNIQYNQKYKLHIKMAICNKHFW